MKIQLVDPNYENFVNLISIVSECQARLDGMQKDINDAVRDYADGLRKEHTELSATIAAATEGIEKLARENRHWFGGKQSLVTPYGTVKFSKGTSIVAASEDASIKLIEASKRAGDFLTRKTELNRQALGKLSDLELAEFGLQKVKSENCNVEPASIDLGNAIKTGLAQPEAAA